MALNNVLNYLDSIFS